MAQPVSPKPANVGGKPGKGTLSKDPAERAVQNLQYTLDRLQSFVVDGGASYARRGRHAARAGVPKERVMKGLDALDAFSREARESILAAYAQPQAVAKPKSRVTL